MSVIPFNLSLQAAEGVPAVEPNCTIRFARTTDDIVILEEQHVVFPPAQQFSVPAWPQEQSLTCEILPSLYRVVQSQMFAPTPQLPANHTVIVLRDPAKWAPDFVQLASLPNPRFARFLDVLKASLDVSLKHGPDLGSLPAIYDGLAGQSRILAKMALLNLYGVLTDTTDPVSRQSWFSFVRKFVLIDRERFVAEVDPALDESVQTILANLSAYSAQGFFTESPKLHYDNIPPAYKLTSDLITLKVRYEQGNVQFTLGRAIGPAATEAVLLDCDMDEHSNVIAHLDDLFIHLFTGGTNPIDIHEYVVHHDAGIDLGYTLRPGSF